METNKEIGESITEVTNARANSTTIAFDNTRIEWKNNHGASYGMASKFGRERFTGHMTRPVKECGYWTKERVAEDAKKYQTRSAWGKKSKTAYSIAQKAVFLKVFFF